MTLQAKYPKLMLARTAWQHRVRALGLGALLICALFVAGWPADLQGKTPEVSITSERDLHFGSFMVFGSGSRTVSASGVVLDNALVALEGVPPTPARFTLAYDRGNESKHVLDIELELVISSSPRVRDGGVDGAVTGLQTDLPGVGALTPGQAIRVVLRNCRSRVCTQSFHVGGRLDVTRNFGGANLVIPIPLDATVISVDRQG